MNQDGDPMVVLGDNCLAVLATIKEAAEKYL